MKNRCPTNRLIPLELALACVGFAGTSYAAGSRVPASNPQVIIDWNNQVFTACASETLPLPQQRCSRALSMVHLAQHDAVNSVDPHYRRYAYHGRPDHHASPVAA